jgi:hypothetical protein
MTWAVCASSCDYSSNKVAIAASTSLNGDTLAIAAGPHPDHDFVLLCLSAINRAGETISTPEGTWDNGD